MTLLVAGVDEVGRGPLAGPVVTAAVILQAPIHGLNDSKALSPKQRQTLAKVIEEKAYCFALGRAEVHEVETLNIHHATLLAMQRAIEALSIRPDKILIDGLFAPAVQPPCETIVNGDRLVPSISAASILAKVARDAEMQAMDVLYPGYHFASNKGYATKQHKAALSQLGPCPIHRRTFFPVAQEILNTLLESS